MTDLWLWTEHIKTLSFHDNATTVGVEAKEEQTALNNAKHGPPEQIQMMASEEAMYDIADAILDENMATASTGWPNIVSETESMWIDVLVDTLHARLGEIMENKFAGSLAPRHKAIMRLSIAFTYMMTNVITEGMHLENDDDFGLDWLDDDDEGGEPIWTE